MSLSLFENATSQYIDSSGKCRMLTYDIDGEKLSLITSPLPPLDIKSDSKIYKATLQVVLNFLKNNKLLITSQDLVNEEVEKGKTEGIWVEEEGENKTIYYGYIPLISTPIIKGVEITPITKTAPLITDKISNLEKLHQTERIANILKQYVLYTYSLNPENFDSNDSFVIIEDYEYNIKGLDKKLFFEDNNIMYRGGKLIVSSEEIKNRLNSYLQVQLLNDKPGVWNRKNQKRIEDYYKTILDFRTAENQLLFLHKTSLLRWKQEMTILKYTNTISPIIIPNINEPYYFRHPQIKSNRIVIIQNVLDGKLERAITISYKWIKDGVKINSGFKTESLENIDDISYNIYDINGVSKNHKRKTKEYASILKYDDNTYAAILSL